MIADPAGTFRWNGQAYAPYNGEWPLTLTTVAQSAAFPDGTVEGRILKIAIGDVGGETSQISYAIWAANAFPASVSSADRMAFADANRDGVLNLYAYAHGLDPMSPSRDGLPAIAHSEKIPGAKELIFSFRRARQGTDLLYAVQISNDLKVWQAAGVAGDVSPAREGEDHRFEWVAYRLPLGVDQPRFVRLELTYLGE